MNRVEKEITIPVFLGSGTDARRKALSLFLRYGICSHFFATKKSFFDKLCFFADFFEIPNYKSADMLEMTLNDHISRYPDKIFVLIPSGERYESFVRSREDSLSSSFIISDMERGVPN